MSAALRPRRSVLFMPAANRRALEKARSLPADGLILDLEDAVAPDAKAAARGQAVAAARAGGYGPRELVLRSNGLDTPWGAEDLAAIAVSGADAVLLPKVESADQVRDAEAQLQAAGAPPALAVWCMLETPRGVLAADRIAAASARLACLVMGTSDLAKELGIEASVERTGLQTGLQLCVLAARSHDLAILDGVHLDLGDAAGLAAQCRQGRSLGFDGKTLIHPGQIDAANAAFGPSAEDIAHARRVIAAHQTAIEHGKGVAVLDGRLVENLHVEAARRTLALAAAIAGAAGAAGAG